MNLELLKELGMKADELATGIKRVIESAYSQCGQDVRQATASLDTSILRFIADQNAVVPFETLKTVFSTTSSKKLLDATNMLVKLGRLEIVWSEESVVTVIGYKLAVSSFKTIYAESILKHLRHCGGEVTMKSLRSHFKDAVDLSLLASMDELVEQGYVSVIRNHDDSLSGWQLNKGRNASLLPSVEPAPNTWMPPKAEDSTKPEFKTIYADTILKYAERCHDGVSFGSICKYLRHGGKRIAEKSVRASIDELERSGWLTMDKNGYHYTDKEKEAEMRKEAEMFQLKERMLISPPNMDGKRPQTDNKVISIIFDYIEGVGREVSFEDVQLCVVAAGGGHVTKFDIDRALTYLVCDGYITGVFLFESKPNLNQVIGWKSNSLNKSLVCHIFDYIDRTVNEGKEVSINMVISYVNSTRIAVTNDDLNNAISELVRSGRVITLCMDVNNPSAITGFTTVNKVLMQQGASLSVGTVTPAKFRTKYAADILKNIQFMYDHCGSGAIVDYVDLVRGINFAKYQEIKESLLEIVDTGFLSVVQNDNNDIIGYRILVNDFNAISADIKTEPTQLWAQVMGRAYRRVKPTGHDAVILAEFEARKDSWLTLGDLVWLSLGSRSKLLKAEYREPITDMHQLRYIVDSLSGNGWLEAHYINNTSTDSTKHAWKYKPDSNGLPDFDTELAKRNEVPTQKAESDVYTPTGRALDVYNYVKQCSTGDVVTNFATVAGAAKHFGADQSLVKAELDLLVEKGLVKADHKVEEYRVINGDLNISFGESDGEKPINMNVTYPDTETKYTGPKAMHIDYIRLLRRVAEAGPYGMTHDLYGKRDESGLAYLHSHGYIMKMSCDSTTYNISTSGKSYIHLYDMQLNEIIEKIVVFLQSSEYGYSLGYDFHNIYNSIGVTDKVTEVREALLRATNSGVIVANANSGMYALPAPVPMPQLEREILDVMRNSNTPTVEWDVDTIVKKLGGNPDVKGKVIEALTSLTNNGLLEYLYNHKKWRLPTKGAIMATPTMAQQPIFNVGKNFVEGIQFGVYPTENSDVMFNVLDAMTTMSPLYGCTADEIVEACKTIDLNYNIELVKQMLDRLVKAKYVNTKPSILGASLKYHVATADNLLFCMGTLNNPSIHDLIEAMPDTNKDWVTTALVELLLADKIKAKFSL